MLDLTSGRRVQAEPPNTDRNEGHWLGAGRTLCTSVNTMLMIAGHSGPVGRQNVPTICLSSRSADDGLLQSGWMIVELWGERAGTASTADLARGVTKTP